MSCGSVVADTSSYDFPFDWEATAYHWDTVVCLEEIVECLENFLGIINEQAYQFFFENVQQAEIDLIGCIDGVCRPATREASKKYLECAVNQHANLTTLQRPILTRVKARIS